MLVHFVVLMAGLGFVISHACTMQLEATHDAACLWLRCLMLLEFAQAAVWHECA
jgi:hypothetical protein